MTASDDLCHNGHPFEPGVSVDHAPGESDPRWCDTCGEARKLPFDQMGSRFTYVAKADSSPACEYQSGTTVSATNEERDDRMEGTNKRPPRAVTPGVRPEPLGGSDSMSVPTRDVSQHPLYAEWMSRIDGCPECAENTEPPQTVEDTGGGGFNAHYRCTDCGHRWETAWWDEPFARADR